MTDESGCGTPYEEPRLQVIGAFEQLTRQNFSNANVDFNFAGIELTGTS